METIRPIQEEDLQLSDFTSPFHKTDSKLGVKETPDIITSIENDTCIDRFNIFQFIFSNTNEDGCEVTEFQTKIDEWSQHTDVQQKFLMQVTDDDNKYRMDKSQSSTSRQNIFSSIKNVSDDYIKHNLGGYEDIADVFKESILKELDESVDVKESAYKTINKTNSDNAQKSDTNIKIEDKITDKKEEEIKEVDNLITSSAPQETHKSSKRKYINNKPPKFECVHRASSKTEPVEICHNKPICRKSKSISVPMPIVDKKEGKKPLTCDVRIKTGKTVLEDRNKRRKNIDRKNMEKINENIDTGTVLEAGDITSLLEKFEATEKSAASLVLHGTSTVTNSFTSCTIPKRKRGRPPKQPTCQGDESKKSALNPCKITRNTLPKEVDNKIRRFAKKTIPLELSTSIVGPNTCHSNIMKHKPLQDVKFTLSVTKSLKVVKPSTITKNPENKINTKTMIQFDHDYCANFVPLKKSSNISTKQTSSKIINSNIMKTKKHCYNKSKDLVSIKRNNSDDASTSFSPSEKETKKVINNVYNRAKCEKVTSKSQIVNNSPTVKNTNVPHKSVNKTPEVKINSVLPISILKSRQNTVQGKIQQSQVNSTPRISLLKQPPNPSQSPIITNKHRERIVTTFNSSNDEVQNIIIQEVENPPVQETKLIVTTLNSTNDKVQNIIIHKIEKPAVQEETKRIMTTSNSCNDEVQNIIQKSENPPVQEETKRPLRKININEYRNRINQKNLPVKFKYVFHVSTTTEPIVNCSNEPIFYEREYVMTPILNVAEKKRPTNDVQIQTDETVPEVPTNPVSEKIVVPVVPNSESLNQPTSNNPSTSGSGSGNRVEKRSSSTSTKYSYNNRNDKVKSARRRSRGRRSRTRSRSRTSTRSRSRSRNRNRNRNRIRRYSTNTNSYNSDSSRDRKRNRYSSRSKDYSSSSSERSSNSSDRYRKRRNRSRSTNSSSIKSISSSRGNSSTHNRQKWRLSYKANFEKNRRSYYHDNRGRSDYPKYNRHSYHDRYRDEERKRSSLYHDNYRRQYDDENVERLTEVEERKILHVSGIKDEVTKEEIYERFVRFGPITDIKLHFRKYNDNYAFVTFAFREDAYKAKEQGNETLPHYKLAFGGRRIFCGTTYEDLDGGGTENSSSPRDTSLKEISFDILLKKEKERNNIK